MQVESQVKDAEIPGTTYLQHELFTSLSLKRAKEGNVSPEPHEISEAAATTKSWRRGGKGRLHGKCPPPLSLFLSPHLFPGSPSD